MSVATGNNEYYPFYTSAGLMFNNVRRAHREGVTLNAVLSIPKSTSSELMGIFNGSCLVNVASREHKDSPLFRTFRRQLFHTSLHHIFESVRPYMTKPKVTRCGDGHFRRIIYSLGPYIADYPEQALLACIVQGWCPKYVVILCHISFD